MHRLTVSLAAGLLGVTLTLAPPNAGTVAAASLPVQVSGASPFGTCSVGATQQGVNFPGTTVEPSVAVNPATLSSSRINVISTWQQDRWSDGASHGLVAGYSFDGGRSWKETALPFSACATHGLKYERASDPWVSIGPDGIAYIASLSATLGDATSDSAVAVVTSHNGGRTWGDLRMIKVDNGSAQFFNDKESITADPVRRGTAYVVWDRTDGGTNSGSTWFAVTRDGGKHWTRARKIFSTPTNNQSLANQIVVDPRNGTIYNFFCWIVGDTNGVASASFQRSTDGGKTWSTPHVVTPLISGGVVAPNRDARLRVGDIIPAATVDPHSGALYLVWEDSRFNDGTYDEIAFTKSSDGGRSWSLPTRVNRPTRRAAFTPSIAVGPNGTIGVAYYDFRGFKGETATLPTDYWLAISRNGGRTFGSEVQLGGPFDMFRAPNAGGYFVGDYEGLTALRHSFLSVFVQTTPGTDIASSAVFSRRVIY